jgi:hypothetical protein
MEGVMQPKQMRLEVVVARWILGLVPSEELPDIAVHALEVGLDTPALRQLAGELRPIMRDAGPIFEKVLVELGTRLPTKSEAGLIVAREYATEITEGSSLRMREHAEYGGKFTCRSKI